jgi:hypothetical protein
MKPSKLFPLILEISSFKCTEMKAIRISAATKMEVSSLRKTLA